MRSNHRLLLSILFIFFGGPLVFAQSTASLPELTWSGDLRYRFDQQNYEAATPEEVRTQRLRARFGFTGKTISDGNYGFRLASGTGRVSTNQAIGTTDESFSSYPIQLDRAYFSVPVPLEARLTMGRFANPFFQAGGQDLLWDLDLNFDGASLKFGDLESKSWLLSASRFLVKAQTTLESAINLDAVQLAARQTLNSDVKITEEISYLSYDSLKDHTGLVGSPTTGNANTSKNKMYACGLNQCYSDDYKILDASVEAEFNISETPMMVFATYLSNTVVSSENDGYIVGAKWNKLRKKYDWSVAYDYRLLQKSSTLGAFTDGESFGGGVNGSSHRLTVASLVDSNLTLSATGFSGVSQIAPSETNLVRTRFLIDLAMTF